MRKTFLFLILPLAIISQEVFASEFGHNQYYFQSPTESVVDEMIPKYQQEVIDYNLKLPSDLQSLHNGIYRPNFYNNSEYNAQSQYGIQSDTYPQNKIFNNQPFTQKNYNQNKNYAETQSTPKWWRQENSYQGWGFN